MSGISNYTQFLIRQALREQQVVAREAATNPKPALTPTNPVVTAPVPPASKAAAPPLGHKETLARIWDEAISNGWQAALRRNTNAPAVMTTNPPSANKTNVPAGSLVPESSSTNGGLVLYLPFNEGKGSVTHDESGYGLKGEAMEPKLPVLWSPGISGQAISTVNSNLFRIPHAPQFSGLRQITVSCWINSTSAPGAVNVWVSKHAGGAHGEFFLAGLTTNSIRWTVVNRSGNRVNVDRNCPRWNDGKWHFIVGTFNGSILRLYFDAMEVGAANANGPLNSFEVPIIIGDYDWKRYQYPSFYYSGLMDEVRIWNRALSPEEVKQVYQKR